VIPLIKIPPEKKDKKNNRPKKETTDEQTDMQSWDRKRQKMENLRMANLLSKKPKNPQMSRSADLQMLGHPNNSTHNQPV
jgi:hypothetical protein